MGPLVDLRVTEGAVALERDAVVVTGPEALAWRMGLYRLGVDAAMFLGPFASGVLGEENARVFVTAVGALALVVGGYLLFGPATSRPAAVS